MYVCTTRARICVCSLCVCIRVWCACVCSVRVCAVCVCVPALVCASMFGTEASHTWDRLEAAFPPSRACGASPGMESWCSGTSQSRELSADIQSAFALEAQGRPRKEPAELTCPPIGGRAGRSAGGNGALQELKEDVRGGVAQKREPEGFSPSERMGCWRGETALETDRNGQRHEETREVKGGFEGEQGRGDRDQQTDPSTSSVFSLWLELATPSRGPPTLALCTSPSSKGSLLSLQGLQEWGLPS